MRASVQLPSKAKDIRSPCEPRDVGVGADVGSFEKSKKCFNHWAITPDTEIGKKAKPPMGHCNVLEGANQNSLRLLEQALDS